MNFYLPVYSVRRYGEFCGEKKPIFGINSATSIDSEKKKKKRCKKVSLVWFFFYNNETLSSDRYVLDFFFSFAIWVEMF